MKLHLPISLRAALLACLTALVSTPAWSAVEDGQEWNPADNCWVHNDITKLDTSKGTPTDGQLTMRPAGSEVTNNQREATVQEISLTANTNLSVLNNQYAADWYFTDLKVNSLTLDSGTATFTIGEGNTVTLGSVASGVTVSVAGSLGLDINYIDDIFGQITDSNGTLILSGNYDATQYSSEQSINLLGDGSSFSFGNIDWAATSIQTASGMHGTLVYENEQLMLNITRSHVMRVDTGAAPHALTSHTTTTYEGQAITPFKDADIDASKSWTMQLSGSIGLYNPISTNVLISTVDPGRGDQEMPTNLPGQNNFCITVGADGSLRLMGMNGRTATVFAGIDSDAGWESYSYDLTISYDSVNAALSCAGGTLTINGTTYTLEAGAPKGQFAFCICTTDTLDQLYTRLGGGSTVNVDLSGAAVSGINPYAWQLTNDATVDDLRNSVYTDDKGNYVPMSDTDTLHFMGGVLQATTSTTLQNPITAESGYAVRLAAAAGSTLTIVQGEAALNSANAEGLEVSGGGTIVLQGLKSSNPVNISIGAATELTLNGSAATITFDAAQNSFEADSALSRTDGGTLVFISSESDDEINPDLIRRLAGINGELSLAGQLQVESMEANHLTLQSGAGVATDQLIASEVTVNSDAILDVAKNTIKLTKLTNEGNVFVSESLQVSGTLSGSGTTSAASDDSSVNISGSTMTGLTLSSSGITASGMEGGSIQCGRDTTGDVQRLSSGSTTFRLGQVSGGSITSTGGHIIITDTQFDAASSISAAAEGMTLTRVSLAAGSTTTVGGGSFTLGDASTGLNNLTLSGEATETTLTLTGIEVNMRGAGAAESGTITLISGSDVTLAEGYSSSFTLNPAVFGELSVDAATGDLVLTLRKDEGLIADQLSDTPNRAATIKALTEQAPAAGGVMQELLDYVQDTGANSLARRRAILSAASGSSVTMLADSQRRGITNTMNSLRNRIIQMGNSPEHEGEVSYHSWIQAEGAYNNISDDGDAAGYSYSTHGGTVGTNIDSGNFSIGLAVTASYGELSGSGHDNAEGHNDAIYGSLFARYQHGNWIHMGIFSAGFNDMDLTRRVMGYEGEGESKGTSFTGYYEAGYAMVLDDDAEQILQPLFSLTLTSAHVDCHRESGSIGNAGLVRSDEDYFYGSVGIGARYQAVISRDINERLSFFELRAKAVQDFGDDTHEATVRFAGGNSPFTTRGAEVGSFGVQVGAGISLPVGMQTTMFMDVDADFRAKASSVNGSVGLRYEF